MMLSNLRLYVREYERVYVYMRFSYFVQHY
jgi:hypothetical protein